MATAKSEPVQEFYSIGEVCSLTELKPHVLRYWESQFKLLNPAKNRSGNRVYARREVELILLVKHLLYTEKFTIDGARQKLDAHRKGGTLRPAARNALQVETIESIERDVLALQAILDGKTPVEAFSDTDSVVATNGDTVPEASASLPVEEQ